jgi:hypothetical protein
MMQTLETETQGEEEKREMDMKKIRKDDVRGHTEEEENKKMNKIRSVKRRKTSKREE